MFSYSCCCTLSSKSGSGSYENMVHSYMLYFLSQDFPEKSFLPKVQLPFFVPPGHCPRKIEIERRKRDYQSQNLESLLESMDIATNELMPKQIQGNFQVKLSSANTGNDPAPFPPFLPLEVFTDMEFDCRTPTEWLAMGVQGGERKPIPAKALLPAWDAPEKCE